jgi:hypothetical protein
MLPLCPGTNLNQPSAEVLRKRAAMYRRERSRQGGGKVTWD